MKRFTLFVVSLLAPKDLFQRQAICVLKIQLQYQSLYFLAPFAADMIENLKVMSQKK